MPSAWLQSKLKSFSMKLVSSLSSVNSVLKAGKSYLRLVTLLLWNNETWLSSSPEVVIVTRGAYRHRPKRGDGTKCCSTHDLASNQLDFHIVIYNKDFQYWDSLCYPRKIFERMYLQVFRKLEFWIAIIEGVLTHSEQVREAEPSCDVTCREIWQTSIQT